jgi:uncharacterized protein
MFVLDSHLRHEILRIAARYGASNLRVFGSRARYEERADSDLDLLASFEPDRSLLDLVGMKQEIEDLLDRPVDVVSERALLPALRQRVLSEAIPL